MAQTLRTASRLLDAIGSYVALPALALLISIDVVLRYGFNTPLPWGLEASRYILLIFLLLGLVESFRVGDHISMELLNARMTPRARRAVAVLQALLLAIVFGFILKKVIEDIPFLYSLPEVTPELRMPVWAFYAFIGFISTLVILYVGHAAILLARGARDTIEETETGGWGL